MPQAAEGRYLFASGVFRTVGSLRPVTLVTDEVDAFLDNAEELRGVLDSGFERSGAVIRVEEIRGEFRAIRFSPYAPVALAAIGQLPATLADQAVPIAMQRKAESEKVEKLRFPGGIDLQKQPYRRLRLAMIIR